MNQPNSSPSDPRSWIARAFTLVEDIVYIALGILLTGCAVKLLATGFIDFAEKARAREFTIVVLLDRILLILLVVELLYTVQVSFREHALVPEPFLLVGLISAIRRVLLLTAEFGDLREKSPDAAPHLMPDAFQHFVIELGVLTVLILALAISLVLLRKAGSPAVASRA
jgi:uncharacterized membrane protein (DUF373 family)